MKYFDSTLKKIISHENLSFDEAKNSMLEIIAGEVSPVKLAAWLVSLKLKTETADEIGGCASALRENSVRIRCDDPFAVDT